MNFVIKKGNTVKWPVTIPVPADGGSHVNQNVEIEFKLLEQPEIDQAVNSGDPDVTLFNVCVVGWKQIQDESGKEMDYSDTLRCGLANMPYFRTAVINAYREVMQGGATKN